MNLKSTKYANIVQDTKVNLDSTTKVFPAGIVIHESDSGKIKVSDGISLYKDLPYVGSDVPTDHSSEEPTFGIGTTEKYGHVKLVNKFNELTITNSDPASRLGLSSYVSDFIIMDDGNYLYIDMDPKIFQPMSVGDTDYLQTFILSPDETDENNIQLVSTGIERRSWKYNSKIFKVNNYYIVLYATSLAYSTDGLSWTVKNYSNSYDEPYSDTLYEHGDILVSIEYFPSTKNYIVGTQNGLITLDENFEFIQYEQVRENSSDWGFTRKHVYFNDGENILCIVCKSNWES